MEVKAVNPEVLRWAVSDAGYDVEALADATKRSQDVVESWLNGGKKPHKGDLDKIAKLLGRNPYFFFRDTPPQEVGIVAKFRKSIEELAVKPAEELKELRYARSVQKVADWAAQEEGVSTWAPPKKLDSSPETAAAVFRNMLHYPVTAQVAASSKSAVFRDFRQQIEALGIIVLLRNAGSKNFRGFSLPHGRVPLIYINAAYDLPTLRTFTLLHEAGHLLRNEETVCHDDDGSVEVWCNRFAAAVLLPQEELKRYLSVKKFEHLNLDAVRLISNRFGASWAAVAIRLTSLGLASENLVSLVEDTRGEFLEKRSGFSTVPQTVTVKRQAEFGATYPRLLIDAVEHGRLSPLDAARYLRADGSQLKELSLVLSKGA